MRKQLRLPDSTTVNELAKYSSVFYPKNELFQALNVLLYRHNPVTEKFVMTSQQLAEAYIQWQAYWKQFQKEQAQKQKQEKKRKGR